jgi:hypothetical protein
MIVLNGGEDSPRSIVPEIVICMKEDDGKEYVIAYLSCRLLDNETRYVFIAKLILSLYYTCNKFRL